MVSKFHKFSSPINLNFFCRLFRPYGFRNYHEKSVCVFESVRLSVTPQKYYGFCTEVYSNLDQSWYICSLIRSVPRYVFFFKFLFFIFLFIFLGLSEIFEIISMQISPQFEFSCFLWGKWPIPRLFH